MNIVALHKKTAFFLDSEKSPRFSRKVEDKALNSAINDIVLDRYDNMRKSQKQYAFQTSQRLRDELYTIVQEKTGLTPTDNVLSVTSMTDYWLLLALEVSISGTTINTIPLTYDERNVIENDPFTRPSIVYPERVYRIESSAGIEIIFGDTGTLVSGHSWYLKKPVKVLIGTEVSNGVTQIQPGTSILAWSDSVLTVYIGGIVAYTVNLAEEEEYANPAGTSVDYIKVTSGICYINYTDTDMPEMLHEEISRKAAAILSGNVENYNRERSLEVDIKNTEQ